MMRRRTFFRLVRIQRILVKYGPDEIISATHLLRPLRFFFYLAPRRRDRLRRSRLYLPGNQPKLMLSAGLYGADALILDLEDSVAPAEKDAARAPVRKALGALGIRSAWMVGDTVNDVAAARAVRMRAAE